MNYENHSLTNAEWYVMEFLWQHGQSTGREATDSLSNHIGWSRSTTLTMLRRMSEKALIACTDVEGTKVYRPLLKQEEATIQETQSFLDRVYHGSIGMMLSAMVSSKHLTKSDIDELYAILKEAEEGAK